MSGMKFYSIKVKDLVNFDGDTFVANAPTTVVGASDTTVLNIGTGVSASNTITIGTASKSTLALTGSALTWNGADLNAANGLVTLNGSSKIANSYLNTAATGGTSSQAAAIPITGNDGKLDASFLPSIAVNEFLGTFTSTPSGDTAWEKFLADIKGSVTDDQVNHNPENGDTVLIDGTLYICVNAAEVVAATTAAELEAMFVVLKNNEGTLTTDSFLEGDGVDITVNTSGADPTLTFAAKLDTTANSIVADATSKGLKVNLSAGAVKDAFDLKADKSVVFQVTSTDPATLADGYYYYTTDNKYYSVASNVKTQIVPAIPIATASVLGGVKIGTNITVANDGTISIVNGSSAVKGVVQVDGSTITASDGVISAATATASALGIVKPDGTTITIGTGTNAGILTAKTAGVDGTTPYLGVVKVDNSTITIDGNGTITAATAGQNTLGIVKADNATITNSSGTLSVRIATSSDTGVVSVDGTTIDVTAAGQISAKKATSSTLGIVQPDNDTITVDSDGVISSNGAKWHKISSSGTDALDFSSGSAQVCAYPAEIICVETATGAEFMPEDIIRTFPAGASTGSTSIVMPTTGDAGSKVLDSSVPAFDVYYREIKVASAN